MLLILLNAYHEHGAVHAARRSAGGAAGGALLDTGEPARSADDARRSGRRSRSAVRGARWSCSSVEPTVTAREATPMAASFAHAMPFGAELQPDGGARFRLWAPGAASGRAACSRARRARCR